MLFLWQEIRLLQLELNTVLSAEDIEIISILEHLKASRFLGPLLFFFFKPQFNTHSYLEGRKIQPDKTLLWLVCQLQQKPCNIMGMLSNRCTIFHPGYVTDIPQRGAGGTQLLPQRFAECFLWWTLAYLVFCSATPFFHHENGIFQVFFLDP